MAIIEEISHKEKKIRVYSSRGISYLVPCNPNCFLVPLQYDHKTAAKHHKIWNTPLTGVKIWMYFNGLPFTKSSFSLAECNEKLFFACTAGAWV